VTSTFFQIVVKPCCQMKPEPDSKWINEIGQTFAALGNRTASHFPCMCHIPASNLEMEVGRHMELVSIEKRSKRYTRRTVSAWSLCTGEVEQEVYKTKMIYRLCCETTSLHQETPFHEVISSIQAQD
jgi:hypothetical protein